MSDELKPCPFCGGTDVFVERLDYSAAYVQCDSRIDEYSACLARGPVGVQEDDGEEIPGAAAAIRAWNEQAARRTAPVSAPMGQELPPPEYFGQGTDGSDMLGYTRESVEQIIDSYAERIRQLERELAERKTASIGEDPEFLELLSDYATSTFTEFQSREKKLALIDYIDGRTAGTALEGWKLVPLLPTKEMVNATEYGAPAVFANCAAYRDYVAMVAAAPTPMNSGKDTT